MARRRASPAARQESFDEFRALHPRVVLLDGQFDDRFRPVGLVDENSLAVTIYVQTSADTAPKQRNALSIFHNDLRT